MNVIERIERGELTVAIGITSYNMTSEQLKYRAELLRLAKIGQRVIDLKEFCIKHESFKPIVEICDIFIEPEHRDLTDEEVQQIWVTTSDEPISPELDARIRKVIAENCKPLPGPGE